MSETKPLHVQVAEAIGWKWKLSPSGNCRFLCPPEHRNAFDIEPDDYVDASPDALLCADAYRYLPRFDRDWAATGPLVERFGISLTYDSVAMPKQWIAEVDGVEWYPYPSALVAVCNCILALKAAGKL